MTDQPAPDPAVRRSILGDGIAVGIATGAYGVSFGAIAVASGLSVLQSCALSLLVFTGASQFALVGVVAAGGAPMSGAVTALLLGTRNTLYGLRLAPLLDWRGWRRAVAAQLTIDESTAMSVNRESTAAARVGFLATGISVFVLWNLATLIGALAGDALGDPRAYGLDAAVGGAFLALLWPRLGTGLGDSADMRSPPERRIPGRSRGHGLSARALNQIVAVAAVALALGLVPFTAAGVPIIASAAVALLAGVLTTRGGERR
ncbi:MAG: AzlC family ABC transporter permease [Nocardioidaceae bacterium]